MSDGIAGGQVVGIDLHLYRSVIARIDERGEQLGWVRIDNDPKALVAECRKAGRGVPVAIEASACGAAKVWINAGQRGLLLGIAPGDALRALGAQAVALVA